MTKNCLRLLFLGALALPLAYSCGDSPLECLGAAVACGDRDLVDCNAGCELSEGCFGNDITCDSLTSNPTLCLQTNGCRYVGTCEGPAGCEERSYSDCVNGPGCLQVERCYGGSVSCNSLEDSQCELYAECALSQRCQGSATTCNELDSTSACIDVPGCYPADTTPSVVD
jgi:hypothetical protein